MKLEYTLTRDEILEGLRYIGSTKEGLSKQLNILVLSAGALVFLVLFLQSPTTLHYLLLSAALVAVMFAILYLPDATRRRTATRLSKIDGIYRVAFDGFFLRAEGLPPMPLEQKKQRIYEGVHVYALFLDRHYHFCIPKRILSLAEQHQLHELLATCPGFKEIK